MQKQSVLLHEGTIFWRSVLPECGRISELICFIKKQRTLQVNAVPDTYLVVLFSAPTIVILIKSQRKKIY